MDRRTEGNAARPSLPDAGGDRRRRLMPIDWEAIVAPFRAVFRSQTKYFTESVREIAKWLKKRLEESRKMELTSRAFPVIDFSEGAVQVSIALFQQNTLGLPKQTGSPRPT